MLIYLKYMFLLLMVIYTIVVPLYTLSIVLYEPLNSVALYKKSSNLSHCSKSKIKQIFLQHEGFFPFLCKIKDNVSKRA